MSKGPLPPEKWLQEREWGRDIVHYANDELDRLSMGERLHYAGMDDINPYVIVFFHMFAAAGDYRVTDNSDERAAIHTRTEPETIVATLLADYLENGRKAVRINTDLFSDGPTAIKDIDLSYLEEQRTLYISLDQCPGKTVNGHDIDGFIVSLDVMPGEEEEDDERFLCILPMSKNLSDHSIAPWPHLLISLDDPDLDMVESSLKWSEFNEQRIKALVQKWGLAADAPPSSAASTLGDIFFDPTETQNIREKTESVWNVKKKVISLYEEEKEKAFRHMSENVETWIKTITGAIAYLATDPKGHIGYEDGADPSLVKKALANGTGARKAKQKLASAGYRSFTIYDGQTADDEEKEATKTTGSTPKEEPGQEERASPKKTKVRIDKRKAKRKARRPISPATVTETNPSIAQDDKKSEKNLASPSEPSPSSNAAAEDILPKAYQRRAPEAGEDVVRDAEELLRRCFRDTPEVGTRDWQSAIASAVSTIIVRRLKIATAPRETIDAARKRIASEIEARIGGLHSAQETYYQNVVQHGGPAAWRFNAPSTLRPIDSTILEDLREPVLIVLDSDPDLARMIAFPGIEPGTGGDHTGEARVLLRLVFEEKLLSVEGFLYEGCLSGYRHVTLDTETGEVQSDDAESDGDDAFDLADRAYAALADTVYGPVDFAEAWRYEQEHEIYRNQQTSQGSETPSNNLPAPKEVSPTPTPAELKKAERAPAPSATSFRSWHNLTLEGSGFHLGTADAAEFILLCSGNAAAQTMAGTLSLSQEQSELQIAWRKHACSIVNSSGRLDAIDAPEIKDDASLVELTGREGILVIRDRAFFENVTDNLIESGHKAPGKPIIVLYRIDMSGFAAFVIQIDENGQVQFAQWNHAPLEPSEDDNDVVWYLRGALNAALPREKSDTIAEANTLLPSMRRVVRENNGLKRQGAKRIIAQTRIHPESIATALSVVVEWFSEQVQRHGDNLVADRREEGDWTLEHVSHDRGMTNFWSVTVRTPDDHSNAIDIIVQTTLATGVQPRLPTLVRRIAERTPTKGPDGLLKTKPEYLTTKGEILSLVRDLQSPDRTLPILVMTQAEDGTYMRDPNEVAAQALGAVTVVKLPQNMTYELTDMLGQEYRTFGGAVRLFQPSFDPDTDPAHRHPRIMPDTMATKALSALISRATSATVTRYDIPDALRIVGRSDQNSIHFGDREDTAPSKPEDIKATPRPAVAQEEPPTSTPSSEEETTKASKPVQIADVHPENVVSETSEKEAVVESPEKSDDPDTSSEKSEPDTQPEEKIARIEEKEEPASTDNQQSQAAKRDTPATPAIDPAEFVTLVSNVVDQRLKAYGLGDLQDGLAQVLTKLDALETSIIPEPARIIDDAEIEALRQELKAERETLNELLDEADAEKRAAVAQVQTLRQALNDQRRQAHTKKTPDYPKDLSGLSDWLDRNVLPNVVITSKAWRNMRKVDYRDMERLCETLKLLDGTYIDMRAGENGAREEWEAGLERLRLQDRKQTKMGVAAREGDYHFRHQGEVYMMDRHLRGTESIFNDHSRLLRIYYHYNPDERLVLIGHMPTHLTTKDS